MWLSRVLKKLQIKNSTQIKVMSNRLSTICVEKNSVHHDRIKHLEIDQILHKGEDTTR